MCFCAFRPKRHPVLRFPAFRPLWRAPVLRFLAFGGKIEQDSCWYIYQHESCSILPPNARKRSTGALHRGRNAGKRSTGAVLKAKMEIMKKNFVSTEGHSKLQKIAFGKICPLNSHFFFDDAFFTKPAVVVGNLRYFWVRNSVPRPEIANRLARMEFRTRKTAKPILTSLFAISGRGTEFLTQK